jgi:hypothetical protein
MAWTLGDAQMWYDLESDRTTAGLTGWERHWHTIWQKWAAEMLGKGLVPPEMILMASNGKGLFAVDTASEVTFDFEDLNNNESYPGDIAAPGYNPFNRPT